MQAVSAGNLRVVSGRRGRLPVIVCGGRQVRAGGRRCSLGWAGPGRRGGSIQ